MQPVREITDRYRTEEVLASDASLTVCSATDAVSGSRVVVELVTESRGAPAGVAGRFLEAVAVLARLRHASLPAVLDGGATEDGVVFLVRESVDGRPFHTLGGESPGQILSLLLQVVGGLELLAAEGIFHGALSLDSLWVAAGPERPRAKVLGLATGVWRSRCAGADAAGGLREDVRALGAIASRLLGATVSDPASEQPGIKLPLAVTFELEDGDALRTLLERCLRRDPAVRPADYSELRKGLCIALWGEPDGGQAPAVGASGAPPARLTFTTVPEDSLIEPVEPPPPRPSHRGRDQGEITKVVLPEELEGWEEEGDGEDTAEVAARAAAEARARARGDSPPAAGPAPPPEAAASSLPEPDEMLSPVDFVPTG